MDAKHMDALRAMRDEMQSTEAETWRKEIPALTAAITALTAQREALAEWYDGCANNQHWPSDDLLTRTMALLGDAALAGDAAPAPDKLAQVASWLRCLALAEELAGRMNPKARQLLKNVIAAMEATDGD